MAHETADVKIIIVAKSSFASLGATIGDLETAWEDRLLDADYLKASGRFSTAISMGLYALEILLKVKICKRLELDQLPRPFETHELEDLMVLSGLSRSLTKDDARTVSSNWTKIKLTAAELNELRYKPNTSKTDDEATTFFSQLRDPTHGVITWLRNQP